LVVSREARWRAAGLSTSYHTAIQPLAPAPVVFFHAKDSIRYHSLLGGGSRLLNTIEGRIQWTSRICSDDRDDRDNMQQGSLH
ncbi:unnamed protein product, partial [Amoebophrya sp. A120]